MKKISDIKTVKEYNLKIDERFIRYISHQKPFTYEEVIEENSKYKRLLKEFKEIKSKELTINSIRKLHQILENSEEIDISEDFINRINNIDTIEKMIDGFVKTIKDNMFLEKTIEMAIIILNWQMIKKKFCPVVFYPGITKQILKSIESDDSQNKIYALFNHAYFNTITKFNQKHEIKTQDEVVKLILNHEQLLKDLYEIKSIGLFGSFARDDQNEYSDIDVWIKTKSRISYQSKYLIKSFLATLLNLRVDLNFWDTNKSKTVFHDNLKIF